MSLRRLVLIPLCLLLALSGCSLLPGGREPDPPQGSEPTAPPAFPVSQFAPIPQQRTTGVDDVITEAAADGNFVVALGTVDGVRSTATFRWSEDGGRAWQEADVAPELRDLVNLSHLIRTPNGWWAMANGHDGYVALTSPDGKAWTMTKIDEKKLNPVRAWFNEVVMVGTTYVAGGTISPTTGDNEVGFWTSSNGVDWQRASGRGQGEINAVAAQGSTLVGVGSRKGSGDELTMPTAWRSDDGGSSWTEQPRPEIGATDAQFYSYFTGVQTVGKGFVASMSAFDTRGDYRPYSYVSRDGRTWVKESLPKAMDGTKIDDVSLAADGKATLFVVNPRIAKTGDQVRIVRRSGGKWQTITLPTDLGGTGEWYVNDLVETDAGVLVFANRNTANTNTASIWRSTDEAATFAKEDYPAAEADVAVVQPTSFARTRDGYVAVGNANGLPAIWRGKPDGSFGSATALSDNLDDTVGGVAANERGLVVWGQQRTLVNDQVKAWHGAHGSTSLQPINATFQTGGDYARSWIADARFIGDQWWMVGETSANAGRNNSALVLSGTSVGSLHRGESNKITHRSTGEYDYELSDLSGDDDHGRGMSDIAQGPNGMVAVGWIDNEAGDNSPAYWTQGTDKKWSLKELPMTDIVTGGATDLLVKDDKLIIRGYGTPRGSDRPEIYFWVSSDGGKTWQGNLVRTPDPQGGISTPYATDNGFVAVGTTGEEKAEPVLWESTDGLEWKHRALPPLRTDPANQEAGVADYFVEGNTLIMLTWVHSSDGKQSASRIVEHQL
ncbi:hypothetical protein ACQBAR_08420 [Propionibacteriaceae bacterium Y1685]|uniref:hypothetical protein n=1 Tax=Microlunatus sp. Y1700 TaxID=3418487 RepID=UPI003B7803CA